jgi:hypothetical protein
MSTDAKPPLDGATGSETVDWPTEPGIWCGEIPGVGWFPMRVRRWKEYPEGVPHLPMPLVAQFPESKTSWPFTVQGCHPAKSWRRPTDDEMRRAKIFYGESPNAQASATPNQKDGHET